MMSTAHIAMDNADIMILYNQCQGFISWIVLYII